MTTDKKILKRICACELCEHIAKQCKSVKSVYAKHLRAEKLINRKGVIKMSKFKKIILNKQIVLSLLVAIVVLTGVINWATPTSTPSQPVLAPSEETYEIDYFKQSKLERDTARSKTMELLEENKQTDEIMKQTKYMQQETTIENLIKAKGYENAVCYLSENSCTVVVKAQGLTAGDVAQIKDIIITNSSVKTRGIKISEHK